MPARIEVTPENALAELERRRRLKTERQRRWRSGRRDTPGAVASTNGVASTYLKAPVDASPPDPPTGVKSKKSLPPLVARLAERLAGFGRGYRDNARSRGRLAKLAGDFPHLDAEEQVEDALDWLERPENAKRYCNLGFLRNWMELEEAKRQRRSAAASGPSPAFGTNGHYQPPITLQKNPGPPDLPRLEAPMERVPLAPRRPGTLKEKLAALEGGRR